MTDEPYTGPERRSSTIVWEIGIARLETKLDALLASVTALAADVGELERRVQVLEVSVARFDQLHEDIAAHTPSPTSWPAVLSSVAAFACIAQERPQDGQHPIAHADAIQWQVAASPGLADAYSYAVETNVPDPGADPAVITDAALLAAVSALLPAAE